METAGEIVTCVFEKEEVRFTREWSSKECEEDGEADRCYSLQRGAVESNKLIKYESYHPMVGCDFGGKIELLCFRVIE